LSGANLIFWFRFSHFRRRPCNSCRVSRKYPITSSSSSRHPVTGGAGSTVCRLLPTKILLFVCFFVCLL
jgi:hypothetical protein